MKLEYDAIKKGFNHAEAFCLMTYQCESCGLREIVWNSRDGVTPFVIGCSKCKGLSQHVDWHYDICDPNHGATRGERIFVNITQEIAVEMASKRLSTIRSGSPLPPKKGTPEYTELFDLLVKDIYGNGDSPTVIEFEDPQRRRG